MKKRKVLTSVSTIAISLLFFTTAIASGKAFAVDECGGAEGMGADTRNCAAATYGTGISYVNSDGLTLNLNNAGIAAGPTTNVGVSVVSTGANTNDIIINGTNFNTISTNTTLGSFGIRAQNAGTAGNAIVTMAAGAIDTSGQNAYGLHSLISNAASTGIARTAMSGGTITTAGVIPFGLYSVNSGMGNAEVILSGTAVITTSSDGLRANINNANSLATSSVTISGGTITASAGQGAYALHSGLGNATILMTDGDIETVGNNGSGLRSEITNTASTATTSARMEGGEIETAGTTAYAVYSLNGGLGAAAASMTGGNVRTTGMNGHAVVARMTNTASNATSSVTLNGATIVTTGNSSHGVLNWSDGRGRVEVTGTNVNINSTGVGLYSFKSNANATGDVIATMIGGLVTAGSSGVLAHQMSGMGKAIASATNATINAGESGVSAQNNGTVSGDAEVFVTNSDIEGSGEGAVYANVPFNGSTGNARVTVNGGSINAGSLYGVRSRNNGLGNAELLFSNGDVVTNMAGSDGLISEIVNVASAGTASLTMQGGEVRAQGTNATGINSSTAGTGMAIVSMLGGSVSGLGNNADGILAFSTSGTFDVNITGGTITGGAVNGAAIHTVAAGGGTIDIGAGVTLNAGASGVAIRDGDSDHNGVDETGGNAVINIVGGIVNGNVILGLGNDSLTLNAGELNGTIRGNDGDDTFTLSNATWTVTNFLGGVGTDRMYLLNAATGEMGALASMDAEHVEIDGSSTLHGAGGGTGVFDFLTAHVFNSGLVSLKDGMAGDIFVAGSWEAGSGIIELDVASPTETDRHLIAGDMTGTTTLRINNIGSGGPFTGSTNVDGISVVQVGGNSTANAFSLENGYAAVGIYRYTLAAFDPLSSDPGEIDPAISAVGDFWDYRLQTDGSLVSQIDAYRNFTMGGAAFSWALLESLHKRAGEIRHHGIERIEPAAGGNSDPSANRFGLDEGPGEFYIRARGVLSETEGDEGAGMEQDIWFVQGGYDMTVEDVRGGTLRFGPALSFGGSKLEIDNGSEVDLFSPSLAMTATYETPGGAYIDGIIQGTLHSADVSTPERDDVADIDGWGAALSAETGIPFAIGKGLNLTPQAQLAYQWVEFENFTDADGIVVEIGSEDNLRGRLGVMVEKTITTNSGAQWAPHMTFDIIHEFLDGDGITAGDTAFDSDLGGTSAEIGIGLHAQSGENTELYFDVSYGHALTDGASESLAGTARVKFTW